MKKLYKEKILILGSTGFVGSAIHKELRKNEKTKLLVHLHKNFNFRNLEKDQTLVSSLKSLSFDYIDKFSPDTIYHCARISGNRKIGRIKSSIIGKYSNEKIINFFIKTNNQVQINYISGSLMYGNSKKKISEKNSLKPISYAKDYIIAEKPFIKNNKNKNLNVKIFRPAWILGKGSWFKNCYLNFIEKNGFIPKYGDGTNIMNFIDLDDCAKIIIESNRSLKRCSILNVYNPRLAIDQNNFIKILSKKKQVPIVKIKKLSLFNNAFYEAMTSSIRLTTIHDEFVKNFKFCVNNIEDLIEKNIQ